MSQPIISSSVGTVKDVTHPMKSVFRAIVFPNAILIMIAKRENIVMKNTRCIR